MDFSVLHGKPLRGSPGCFAALTTYRLVGIQWDGRLPQARPPRQVNAPFPVGDYTVPPGTLLTCSMILTHSRPDLYPNPGAFRPERFMADAPDTYTWLPFGGGTRRCIGAAFATLEMKVILRHVFSQCALEAPDPKPERPRRRFVTYPPNRGAKVVLRGRTAT
jgi:cytochrome P450